MDLRRAVLQRHAGGGRRLARDAEQRQTVGAVEGQLEVHDRVAQPQHVADVVAKPTGLLHNENAVLDRVREVVDRQPQLGQRAEHTLRDHPAQLAGLDDLAAGQLGAVEADGDEVARVYVLRAGDDLQRLLAADVDDADYKMVGVGVGRYAVDSAGDDVLDVLAEPFYRLDLRPGTRHQLGVVAVGEVKFYIVFQPVE